MGHAARRRTSQLLAKPWGWPAFIWMMTGCRIYDARPSVCRAYRPDELCLRIAAPTLAERVRKYLELFGLEGHTFRAGARGRGDRR